MRSAAMLTNVIFESKVRLVGDVLPEPDLIP